MKLALDRADLVKLAKAGALAGATLAAGVAFNVLHFVYFPVRVVLYDAIQDAAVGSLLFAALYGAFLHRRLGLGLVEATLAIAVGFFACVNYAVLVPAVIDRSLSVYILEKIDQRGGGVRAEALERVFTQEYVPEHRLMDIRMTEQLESGTIEIRDGCVLLTARGRAIVGWTRFYRATLLPKRRRIMGEFSDDLTHPLENSNPVVDYTCAASPAGTGAAPAR